MNKIRWIHFSDLHLGSDDSGETSIMRRELPTYIAHLNETFDYAFCSGDIKDWNTDYTGASEYIRSLCSASHTDIGHLFIVPGNHDIDAGDNKRTELIERITDWGSDYYQSSQGCVSQEDISLLKSGQEAFHGFIADLFGHERDEMYSKPHFTVTTEHLNILHLDSTLTYGKGHNRDFVIGAQLFQQALDACDSQKPTVILTHYSFDYLAQDEKNVVEKFLSHYNVQLWFAGHEHENLIRMQRDKFYECQAGNLALQNGARSCILSGELDLDTGAGTIIVHAWYEAKGWASYPFARVGSENNEIYPFQISLHGEEISADVSAELANARETCEDLTRAGGPFSGVDVNPFILTDLEYSGKRYYNNNGHVLPLAQVTDKLWADKRDNSDFSCNALVLGDGGMGKSTMLFHECRRLLSDQRLSIFISLQARESENCDSLQNFILRCLYKSEDDRAKNRFLHLISACHTHPDLVLFIDGFNELSGAGAKQYVAEIKMLSRFPGIQIIISSRLDFLRDYGLSHFGMIQTCDLRNKQIKRLFAERRTDWNNVQTQKSLLTLLKNPMMALLYARTCPIVERHANLDYLKWIKPITNASDLLHDYYMSQVAILLDRNQVDGERIFDSMVVIDRILPRLAYHAERQNALGWKEELFEEELKTITREVNSRYLGENISNSLNRIKRRFRIGRDFVGDLYDLIVSEMVLLKPGNGRVSFSHQIFRDYLAAVYLHNCLAEDASGDRLWHDEEIHKGVVQYLRFMEDARIWDAGGMICRMLEPYRGREIAPDDHFISNILNCWLPVGNGKRDLSGLDLRRVSLSEHLKVQFPGTININNAWLEKETLINDKHHDRIAGFSFSHDHHTLAVVSSNGLVSIINLLTQSQMIVGVLLPEPGQAFQIGFTSEDYLVVCTGRETYKWTSFSYDKTEKGSPEDIVCCPLDNENVQKQIESLEKQLKESRLEGIIRCSSENGRYLAVGFESGFVQVWDVPGQNCLAAFSLSDSQITTVAFTKDGKIAALGSGGKLVQIWDMEECKWIKTLSFPKRVSGLRLPREGNSLECRFSDGTYYMVDLETSSMEVAERPKTKPFISKTLRGYLRSRGIADSNIQSSPGGNAIVLTQDGEAYTWDEKLKKFNPCPGHNSRVSAIAMCDSDERFAASYSPENYPSEKRDGRRRAELDNQKLVRVRIVKTGQCQWRLPTKKRDISKLRFFTGNRIILAAYATNGDILLWELINRVVFGKEWGHWENVEIIRNNQSEPLECAFPDNGKDFISAYADGTILIRPFSTSSASRKIATIPGIDAGVFCWDDLKCDGSLKQMLMGYQHKDS